MTTEFSRERLTVQEVCHGEQKRAAVQSEIFPRRGLRGPQHWAVPQGRDHLFTGGADAVFYIQSGMVKVSVVSEQGKEAVVAMLGPNSISSVKDVLLGRRCA